MSVPVDYAIHEFINRESQPALTEQQIDWCQLDNGSDPTACHDPSRSVS